MNKGFTKLEIVLVGVILLITVGFMAKNQISNPTGGINQTPTKDNGLCSRTQPYTMALEFARAISLLKERGGEVESANKAIYLFYNCLDIQYSDLSETGAEGFFLFDPNSSTQDLKIFVSSEYKNYDDILTAVLFAHEFRHVNQFLETKTEETKNRILSCIHMEVQAFSVELTFISRLNEEEINSLYLRLLNNPNQNSAYQGILQLLKIRKGASNLCGNNFNCYNDEVLQKIRTMVLNNPFYQKQCEGTLNDPPVITP